MLCPKCNNPNYKYIQKRESKTGNEKWKRSDFRTICSRCGFSGFSY